MKKQSWLFVTVALALVVSCFLTGCASGKQEKKVDTRAILRTRDSVPPPYSSPSSVKELTPEPAAPAIPAPAAKAPTSPSNLASTEQPAIPGQANLFVPAETAEAPAPTINSLFTGDDGTTAPTLVAVSTAGQGKPATVKPTPIKKQASPAPKAGARTYKVVQGDRGYDIAYRYGVAWKDIAALNGLSDNSILHIGTVLTLPDNALETPRTGRPRPKATAKQSTSTTSKSATATKGATSKVIPAAGKYTVKSGDSLWTIARAHGVKFEDIKAWNPEAASKGLKVGQVVMLKGDAKAETKKTETKAEEPKKDASADKAPQVVVPDKTPVNQVLPAAEPAPAQQEQPTLSHTIAPGETLAKIASYYGASVESIKLKNPTIMTDNDLKPGEKILIPYTSTTP